jgi:hypothetical protein
MPYRWGIVGAYGGEETHPWARTDERGATALGDLTAKGSSEGGFVPRDPTFGPRLRTRERPVRRMLEGADPTSIPTYRWVTLIYALSWCIEDPTLQCW